MKTIIVTGSESSIALLVTLAAAVDIHTKGKLDIVRPDDDATITITAAGAAPQVHEEVTNLSPFVGNSGPRVHYRAVNVEEAPQALEGLGKTTMIGLIFAHIVGGTVRGDKVTAKYLRQRTKFNKATLENRINDLKQAGLVVSETIPFEERVTQQ